MAEETKDDAAAKWAEELARTFDRVFQSGDGEVVLNYLDGRFRGRQTYAQGGRSGQRETDRRAAHKEVIDHIYQQMLRAQQGDPNE